MGVVSWRVTGEGPMEEGEGEVNGEAETRVEYSIGVKDSQNDEE